MPTLRLRAALAALLLANTASAQLIEYSLTPRVIRDDATTPTLLRVVTPPITTAVQLNASGGGTLALTEVSPNVWEVSVPAAQMLAQHAPGALHAVVGQLATPPSGQLVNVSANVRTAGVPDVTIKDLAPDVRLGPHVLNLVVDAPLLGTGAPTSLTQRIYDVLADDYDFLAVVDATRTVNNRFFVDVRNDVQGTGKPIFDDGALWGSPARLSGIVNFPVDSFFDLAETANLHELSHDWLVFTSDPALGQAPSHWPLSDLMYGIMGLTGGGGQGVTGPFQFIEQPGDEWLASLLPQARAFNDLELYLMGLLDASETEPHFVFADQDQALFPGALLQGPVIDVGVAELIAADGLRLPAAGVAPSEFRVATVVLSVDAPLSDEELAYFDHMALRGESLIDLPFTSGLAVGTTQPFFSATGGRGTLATSLAPRVWADVGDGLVGFAGLPKLEGVGTLDPGTALVLELSQARANSGAYLVLGLSDLFAPFKGGVLVPAADIVKGPFPVNAVGSLTIGPVLWPGGLPPDFTFYLQEWVIDGSNPGGFAASNGLAVTPP